jgi:hypothetical protein
MARVIVGALVGMLAGSVAVALLLPVAAWAVEHLLAPPAQRVEHAVIYQCLVLGAGFGSVCGSLAGLARVALRLPPPPPRA